MGQDLCVVATEVGVDYEYDKLATNINRRGGDLQTINPIYQSTREALQDASGVILLLHQVEGETRTRTAFRQTLKHVRRGGRAALFFTEQGIDSYETIVLDSLQTAIRTSEGLFPGNATPNYIEALGKGRLGSGPITYQRGDVTRQYEPSLADMYFLPPLGAEKKVLEKGEVENRSTNETLTVYLKMRHGEGTLIIASSPQTREGIGNPFFSDENIERYDNRQLTDRLVQWLQSSS